MFRQTRLRLVAWNVLVLALILTLVGGAVYFVSQRQLMSEVDRALQARSRDVPRGGRPGDQGQIDVGPAGYSGAYFTVVYGSEGEILNNPQQVGLKLDVSGVTAPEYRTVTLDDEPARVYITPVSNQRGPQMTMVVGESLTQVNLALRRLLFGLLAGGGAGLALSFAGAWFLAGRALVPIEFAFRRQQEFVADASHELRTPLTVLHASADLLNQHRSEPLETNGQLFDDFRQELLRLERLATDLLLLARADLGQIELAVAPVDVGLLAGDVVRRTTPLAQAHGVNLRMIHREQTSEPIAEVDPDRIQQVLLVLIDNALKHVPPGGEVTVDVEPHGHDVDLVVRDTGSGIAPEHLPRLFDRFYRADRARNRDEGSTGLGLPIAKTLVEAHDGQLTIASTVGAGTTATIRLPLVRASESLSGKIGRLTVRGSRSAEQP
jgi:signal transduction histidine kinase